jgi:hypothetical protein
MKYIFIWLSKIWDFYQVNRSIHRKNRYEYRKLKHVCGMLSIIATKLNPYENKNPILPPHGRNHHFFPDAGRMQT